MSNPTNQNITKNILRYLNNQSKGQAILLDGEWGCGKTHFINEFIARENHVAPKKVLVSLFGMRSVLEIQEQILISFFPVAGTKLGKAVRSIPDMLKGVLRLDVDGDGKSDIEAAVKQKGVRLYDLIFENKNDFALILDDLERTSIPINDLLGYINHLVETCQIKTILIANESEFSKDSKELYYTFKEKVISKTFKVDHDAEAVIQSFMEAYKEDILKFKKIILEVYALTNSKNLRSVRQSIDDFSELYNSLNENYKAHEKYMQDLCKTFFSLSLATKNSTVDKHGLSTGKVLTPGSDFTKLYFRTGLPILKEESWVEIIFESNYSSLNEISAKHHFFNTPKEHEKDILEELQNYTDLEFEDFEPLRKKLEADIKENLNCHPLKFIKKCTLLASFVDQGLSSIKTTYIAKQIDSYTETMRDAELLHSTSPIDLNRYELEHIQNSQELIDSYNNFRDTHNSIFQKAELDRLNKKNLQKAESIYAALTNGNTPGVISILLKDERQTPMAELINASQFAEAILKAPNKAINELSQHITNRYYPKRFQEAHNEKETALERHYWMEVRTIIGLKIEEKDNLKKFVLYSFLKVGIDNIMILMPADPEIEDKNLPDRNPEHP